MTISTVKNTPTTSMSQCSQQPQSSSGQPSGVAVLSGQQVLSTRSRPLCFVPVQSVIQALKNLLKDKNDDQSVELKALREFVDDTQQSAECGFFVFNEEQFNAFANLWLKVVGTENSNGTEATSENVAQNAGSHSQHESIDCVASQSSKSALHCDRNMSEGEVYQDNIRPNCQPIERGTNPASNSIFNKPSASNLSGNATQPSGTNIDIINIRKKCLHDYRQDYITLCLYAILFDLTCKVNAKKVNERQLVHDAQSERKETYKQLYNELQENHDFNIFGLWFQKLGYSYDNDVLRNRLMHSLKTCIALAKALRVCSLKDGPTLLSQVQVKNKLNMTAESNNSSIEEVGSQEYSQTGFSILDEHNYAGLSCVPKSYITRKRKQAENSESPGNKKECSNAKFES